MAYCGRTVIYSDFSNITADNVVQVVDDTMGTHSDNSAEIDYLYNYYRGNQPILSRTKTYNDFVNNIVLVNRANEIVSFKAGYLMGEPVQYTARSTDTGDADNIVVLNDYCYTEGKASKDMELAVWFYIAGTAYRMVKERIEDDTDESPFEVYTLDPRNTYVVYHSGLGHKALCGVTYVILTDGTVVYSVYTPTEYFEIIDGQIVKEVPHSLGSVPIIEYPANDARLGAFEIVITMLDAINTVSSNRIDGVEQFIQALMVFKGAEVDKEAFESFKEMGAIKIPPESEVYYLVQELNQSQTQTLIDDMYSTVLEICGMPSQGDGSTSDSSNNGAMIIKNGWQQAEARAMDSERMFKESEKKFLKIAINIANTLRKGSFRLADIDIKFTRRNYENILQKSQVLISMLSSGKIDPKLAFTHSGMFTDPELAYEMSKKYAEKQEKKAAEMFGNNQSNGSNLDSGEPVKPGEGEEGNEDE